MWDLHSEYMDRSLIHRLIFATYISAVLALCFADSNPDTVTGSYINYINTSVTVCPGFGNDKIVHLLMFFPFPILAIHAFGRNKKSLPQYMVSILVTLLAGILTGGVIELLQGVSGYRSCDIKDFCADCLGTLLGAALTLQLFVLYKIKRQTVLF